jgi:hypothetical protein
MRVLHHSARWMFFAALFAAPWYYGGTTATSIVVVNWLLAAAILLWIVDLILNRRLPKLPLPAVLIVSALLLIGWWMTLNARSIYDGEFGTFVGVSNYFSRMPGSVDYAISLAWMTRAVLLLMSILFVADCSRRDGFLLQLWSVIALTGGSVALLGLLQKATGAHAIFWQTPIIHYTSTFFATYYYHANAGAFLNLVLPFAAGFAVRTFGRPSSPVLRALWLTIFLLIVAAIAANTSRMAQLIGALVTVALLIRFGRRVVHGLSRSEKNVVLAGGAAMLFAIYAVSQASHLEQPMHRWETIGEQMSADARWAAARVALNALPQAGLLGFGPGTFRAVFPAFIQSSERSLGGEWRFLHQDYLQTVIEWGWLGGAIWALLFFGGVTVAIVKARKPEARDWSWRRRIILQMSIFALCGVALHALVDFPLQIESLQLYVAACLGVCWSSLRWKAGGQERKAQAC